MMVAYPVEPFEQLPRFCDSEVLRARDMIAEMSHASAGTVKGIKNAIS